MNPHSSWFRRRVLRPLDLVLGLRYMDDPKDPEPTETPVVDAEALVAAVTIDDIIASTNVPWDSTDNRGASDYNTKDPHLGFPSTHRRDLRP